jgi:hypothetical protein
MLGTVSPLPPEYKFKMTFTTFYYFIRCRALSIYYVLLRRCKGLGYIYSINASIGDSLMVFFKEFCLL